MRSLLHQTTLAITTVLVLISCATQTQAAGTAVTGNQAKEYYARNFIERVAAKEGISNLEWIAVESNAALVSARTTLKGANEEYRNYVKDPVKFILVPAEPSQPAGNCLVYRYANGHVLWELIDKQNYADKLITLSQIMPQLLKGSIYLYNAGIRHIDLILDYTTVLQQPTGQLKATMFGFDAKAGSQPLPPQQQLDINTPFIPGSPGSPNPYTCTGYHKELLQYIAENIKLLTVENPHNITPKDYATIAQYIKESARAAIAQDPTGKKLEEATAAHISLLRVAAILTQVQDCTALVTALKSTSLPVPVPVPTNPSGNRFTQLFHKTR